MSGIDESTPALTTPQEWRDYLREYNELYLRTEGEYQRVDLGSEQEAARWMGHEPATEEVVLAAERRLGVRFPPSYRAFLLASDGWDGVGGWIELIWSCERIPWMRDTRGGADLIDLYGEDPDDEYAVLFRRALDVAEGEDFWFLDPDDVGPEGEWAAYLFEPKYGELKKFAGFAELFRASRRLMEEFAEDDH
ncbi:SMI1/KNR4 family protein [Saccharopolyspora sp. NPDC050642]|uniref:SMI1/KNR4 family protein n=1 Tax=Saccharopolyspora sp. NPDC050642 TaxID=3157099 RepID=UPI0033D824D2